jgi:UDP-2-acetamido-2-deoxy-ribo-hexuluronate aminotransferase
MVGGFLMDFIDLKKQYKLYKDEINSKIQVNLDNASFINGTDVKELENNLSKYLDVKHAISCSSGTDALLISLMAYDIKEGDEIITTPFTFAATAEVACILGAKPVFVDIDDLTYNIDPKKIEEKITKKTKGIIPVSLYGQVADMDEINKIAKKHGLFVIEDGCQSFGAIYKGKKSCALSDLATTSFFPSKPLGCYGDGGMIFTDNTELFEKTKAISNHGQKGRYNHVMLGLNFRLDTIQAGILLAKFKHFEKECLDRFKIGNKYSEKLKNLDLITPHLAPYTDRHVYAQYSVRVKNRNDVIQKLKEKNIPTAVHYPIPLHMQPFYKYLNYKVGDFPISELVSREIMSLPMHPFLTDEDMDKVVKSLKEAI